MGEGGRFCVRIFVYKYVCVCMCVSISVYVCISNPLRYSVVTQCCQCMKPISNLASETQPSANKSYVFWLPDSTWNSTEIPLLNGNKRIVTSLRIFFLRRPHFCYFVRLQMFLCNQVFKTTMRCLFHVQINQTC